MGNCNQRPIIDLHSHVLPQMDDGCESGAVSVQLLQQLYCQGVRLVCATSHFYSKQESIESFLQRRRRAAASLGDVLEEIKTEDIPVIRLGAEVAYFHGISQEPGLNELCLGGTKSLLLELPFFQWEPHQMEEVASLCLDYGYHVILAHPERFSHVSTYWKDIERLLALPVALQINADSLLHRHTRKVARELLEYARYPLLSSDCHNITSRPPRIEKARQWVESKLGTKLLNRMDELAVRYVQVDGIGSGRD